LAFSLLRPQNNTRFMDKKTAITQELPHLMRYARALKRDVTAADDLVQDCVGRALAKLDLFQAGTNMRAWLLPYCTTSIAKICAPQVGALKPPSWMKLLKINMAPRQLKAAA